MEIIARIEKLKKNAGVVDKAPGLLPLSRQASHEFEDTYIRVRNKEQRILSDEQVSRLPYVEDSNPHYKEWCIRQKSSRQVLEYLDKQSFNRSDWFLEIGCGNGWFSSLLAKTVQANVLAIDINMQELEQAARVFKRDNLYFAYLDIMNETLESSHFSVIFFNSSFQYFENSEALLDRCVTLLGEKGEIHIIDSPFYTTESIEQAKLRTQEYYQHLDAEEMTRFYHHHCDTLLEGYNAEFLYQASKHNTVASDINSPFPWIKITK